MNRHLNWQLMLILLFVVAGCGSDKENPDSTSKVDESGEAKAQKSAPSSEPHFRLTAERLFKEIESDQEAATAKYEEQAIEISGVVSHVGRNPYGDSYLMLEVEGAREKVLCYTRIEEPWGLVSPGQSVVIHGTLTSVAAGIVLNECDIVSRSANPVIVTTSAELVMQLLDDSKAFKDKYKDKWLILEARIADLETSGGSTSVYLNAPNEVKIACEFSHLPKHLLDSLEVNRPIKVFGQVHAVFSFDNQVPQLPAITTPVDESVPEVPSLENEVTLVFCQLITEAGSSAVSGVQD